jgi:hypothetical protein
VLKYLLLALLFGPFTHKVKLGFEYLKQSKTNITIENNSCYFKVVMSRIQLLLIITKNKLFTTITNNDLIDREKKYKTSDCSFIYQWIQFRSYRLVKNCKHAIQATSLYKLYLKKFTPF